MSDQYDGYLQTAHWKIIAEETKRLAGYRCQICNAEGELHAHHRTYERKGDELQSDLVCLCLDCHILFHKDANKIEEDKRIKKLEFDSRMLKTLRGIILSYSRDSYRPDIYARLDKLLELTEME